MAAARRALIGEMAKDPNGPPTDRPGGGDRPTLRAHAGFSGVVLAGGRSSRMGMDKAFLELDALDGPLICVARDALLEAGATSICSVGGDRERLDGLGFDAMGDGFPGEGPLGGLITGLHCSPAELVVVLSCDLPAIDAVSILALVDALGENVAADAAVPILEGRLEVLIAVYRRKIVTSLEASFVAGERSVRRALESARVIQIEGIEPVRLFDIDGPEDIGRWAR